jgi:hypothetical protein
MEINNINIESQAELICKKVFEDAKRAGITGEAFNRAFSEAMIEAAHSIRKKLNVWPGKSGEDKVA